MKMKTFLLKPGFELIFALGLIAILALPPVLLAQSKKNMDINIVNGDTTVNGKNIKDLSSADRKEALKDINRMGSQMDGSTEPGTFTFRRRDSVGGRTNRVEFRRKKSDLDSTDNIMGVRPGNSKKMNFAFKYRNSNENNTGFRSFNPSGMGFERRNSQKFDYLTTDEDGISTHITFHISEVSNDDLKRMPHVEGGKFEISDLTLVPEFSTGKTLLMFNLPAKTIAEAKLTDSEGKILWNEKTTGGRFSKTIVFGLNGIYYLQVKQGHNIAVKKIMKEE
ncbi:MAG: hypothetical protein JWP44_2387 [Mucilaginibacter sp.]|nr:hypothetical protein [Mucilaginibacter sp.]